MSHPKEGSWYLCLCPRQKAEILVKVNRVRGDVIWYQPTNRKSQRCCQIKTWAHMEPRVTKEPAKVERDLW